MAGKKAALPAPIDRPLSRAYLREFTGWSTAYPPGVSDPTSLRVMKNVLVNRDGSVRVRPGLRLMLFDNASTGTPLSNSATMVGSFEPFYLNDGRRAYLVARRYPDAVKFEYAVQTAYDDRFELHPLGDAGFDLSAWGGGTPQFTLGTKYVRFLQIDNKILALSDNGEPLIVFEVGATKRVPNLHSLPLPNLGSGQLVTYLTTEAWLAGAQTSMPPTSGENSANSLSSSDQSKNVYNMAFLVTFSNELGESVAGDIFQTRIQRPFGSWLWETPGTATPGFAPQPSGVPTADPKRAADHIIVKVNAGVVPWVRDQGATSMNLYMMTWSIQGTVPVELTMIAQKKLTPSSTDADGWIHVHPGVQYMNRSLPIPTPDNRYNSSAPPSTAQGIVASDRLVLVNDPNAAAVIRWSTNQQGNYLDLSPAAGGGYKTLTSGNLQVPACVKLWQNPQSADTLIVLCMGDDGHSASYYMAPASVTSQSDNTQVMGFEETTATPGTVSPYGCEVANNALFHPLDDQLMKSTASNYNINHKSTTDQIVNMWQALKDKDQIVSCFFDQRLYFLVHNPHGEALEPGCMGNEVWVYDLASEKGNWSRWLVQGASMRKLEANGRIMLGLVRPNGIYAFDEQRSTDDVVVTTPSDVEVLETRNIAWAIETNTQGANRAHDAPCHLQQVNLTLGNFAGTIRYGIRAMDIHGRWHTYAKKTRLFEDQVHTYPELPWEFKDMLLVKRDMIEWFFFAETYEVEGELQPSAGQLSLVQYRYTPASVNVGYEYGSVESFEYGRASVGALNHNTVNGIPEPFIEAPSTLAESGGGGMT